MQYNEIYPLLKNLEYNQRPPWAFLGRAFSCPCPPIPSGNFPPLVRPPIASRRHFCAHVQQSGTSPKKQNICKGHLQALHSAFASGSVPYIPTPQNAVQRPAQRHTRHKATPAHSVRSKPGVLLFVAGQGEDGAAGLVGVPPGTAGAVALPADILHVRRLTISAALYRANPQYCVQIGRLSSFQRAQLPTCEAVIVAGLCAIVATIVDSRFHSRYSSTTTDPAIRSSSCFWSGESPRGVLGVKTISC